MQQAERSPHVNGFPLFADGDTELAICGKRYKLQSSFLKLKSTVFRNLLREPPSYLISKNRQSTTVRFILALQPFKSEVGVTYAFTRVAMGKTVIGSIAFQAEPRYVDREMPICRFYDMVLMAMHDIAPNFNLSSTNTLRVDAAGVVACAKAIGALPAVSAQVERVLLGQNQALFLDIAREPLEWLNIAVCISSPTIYKEAVIHLTGRYRSLVSGVKPPLKLLSLPPNVQDLVARKHLELHETCIALCSRIASHYPDVIVRKAPKNLNKADHVVRNIYAAEIYPHMALSFFRHWYALQITNGALHGSDDIGWGFVKKISEGGESYLTREECGQFHDLFPMSPKSRQMVYGTIFDIKESMRRWARPLMRNEAALDVKNLGREIIKHFTCTKIDHTEYIFDNTSRKAGRVTGEGQWIATTKTSATSSQPRSLADDAEDDITGDIRQTGWRSLTGNSAPNAPSSFTDGDDDDDETDDSSDNDSANSDDTDDDISDTESTSVTEIDGLGAKDTSAGAAAVVDLMDVDSETSTDSDVRITDVRPEAQKSARRRFNRGGRAV